MGPAGVRFAAVRAPENVPEVEPAGRPGNGKITGPFVPSAPKWMWPATSELVKGGLPTFAPKEIVKSISVAALFRINVAVPRAGEPLGGFSPAPDNCAANIRSARAIPGIDSSTTARAIRRAV
jgi:hypothetical protein